MIKALLALRERLNGGVPSDVLERAIRDNSWFTKQEINSSLQAICEQMLDENELCSWLSAYKFSGTYNIGVIMAGNIPFVGFYDVLAVLVSGSACYYKTSSKDKVLMDWVVAKIKALDYDFKVFELKDDTRLDAIIATGSDNSNRYFESRFGQLKSLYRGSRASVAVVESSVSDAELCALHKDIFLYSGLGCRNVSHLYLERGFDVKRLVEVFEGLSVVNSKYINNYKYQKAEKVLNGESFIDGGYYTLQEKDAKIGALSEISFSYYDKVGDVVAELENSDSKIQCVVSVRGDLHARGVKYGFSQSPTLFDAPDSKDVLKFISEIGVE